MSARMLPLFDACAHLGRSATRDVGDGSTAAMLAEMDVLGIDRALVSSAVSRTDAVRGNAIVTVEVARSERLSGVWVVPPPGCGEGTDHERFVEAARDAGVAVVRALPAHQGYRLAAVELEPLWSALAGSAMTLAIDASDADVTEIAAVAANHPDLTVLVGDLGYRSMRAMATLFPASNVLFATNNLSGHQALEWLVGTIGVERVLFGTGGPTRDGAEAVTRLLLSSLSESQLQRVGSANLEDVIARAR